MGWSLELNTNAKKIKNKNKKQTLVWQKQVNFYKIKASLDNTLRSSSQNKTKRAGEMAQ